MAKDELKSKQEVHILYTSVHFNLLLCVFVCKLSLLSTFKPRSSMNVCQAML